MGAAACDTSEVSRLLALNRPMVNPQSGHSALHWLAFASTQSPAMSEAAVGKMASLLLHAGCCSSLRDREGLTALDILEKLEGRHLRPAFAALLDRDMTPLHSAESVAHTSSCPDRLRLEVQRQIPQASSILGA